MKLKLKFGWMRVNVQGLYPVIYWYNICKSIIFVQGTNKLLDQVPVG